MSVLALFIKKNSLILYKYMVEMGNIFHVIVGRLHKWMKRYIRETVEWNYEMINCFERLKDAECKPFFYLLF